MPEVKKIDVDKYYLEPRSAEVLEVNPLYLPDMSGYRILCVNFMKWSDENNKVDIDAMYQQPIAISIGSGKFFVKIDLSRQDAMKLIRYISEVLERTDEDFQNNRIAILSEQLANLKKKAEG